MWKAFLKSEANLDDPFLRTTPEEDKASLVGLMMLRRYQDGHRGKSATSFTAGIRLRFAQETLSTNFLDAVWIATARSACKLNAKELRVKRNNGPASSVKLPVCESLITDMRERLWVGKSWSEADLIQRMTYLGCMWGFDLGARISEYTLPEPGAQDHCIRTDDLSFTVQTPSHTKNIVGSELSLKDSAGGGQKIVECRVLAASSKGKVVVKAKLIGRRSPEEAQFLDDVADFVMHSAASGTDELLSFRKSDGRKVALRGRGVRDELKKTCHIHGLPPTYFSSHSLRKGAITHMRSQGATEDDRRDRGNYAPGSQVMNSTYDYAIGLGPLASNSLTGGHKPTLEDVRRLLPAAKGSQRN
jgi:hypothetical protein